MEVSVYIFCYLCVNCYMNVGYYLIIYYCILPDFLQNGGGRLYILPDFFFLATHRQMTLKSVVKKKKILQGRRLNWGVANHFHGCKHLQQTMKGMFFSDWGGSQFYKYFLWHCQSPPLAGNGGIRDNSLTLNFGFCSLLNIFVAFVSNGAAKAVRTVRSQKCFE